MTMGLLEEMLFAIIPPAPEEITPNLPPRPTTRPNKGDGQNMYRPPAPAHSNVATSLSARRATTAPLHPTAQRPDSCLTDG